MKNERSEIFHDILLDVLGKGKRVKIRPFGSSMAPTILSGEAVIIEPIGDKTVNEGDIVVVESIRPRLHRVVHIDKQKGMVITRGDAFNQNDPPVSLNEIWGRLVSIKKSPILRAHRLLVRFRSQCARVVLDGFYSLASFVFSVRR